MKRFTLIELIVSIVVISILSVIVIINVLNLKKEAVYSTISQNISILQSTMDEHYTRYETYPVLNLKELNIANPILIDVEFLKEKNYLKDNLDMSSIPDSYYWLDVNGQVWGSTNKELEVVNVIGENPKNAALEILAEDEVTALNIYETRGYSKVSYNPLVNLEASKTSKKYHKQIESFEFEQVEDRYVYYEIKNSESVYLASTIDEYGLESAPKGLNEGKKQPLAKGDGTYIFAIENEREMYWIYFEHYEETPGDSSVTYEFRVKDKNGVYQEWTSDFYSLETSTGIEVKVTMKSDADGNEPILNDVRVHFKYLDELGKPMVRPEVDEDEFNETCPNHKLQSTVNVFGHTTGEGKSTLSYGFVSKELDSLLDLNLPTAFLDAKFRVLNLDIYKLNKVSGEYELFTDEDAVLNSECMVAVYEIEVIERFVEDKFMCPKGGSANGLNSDGYVLHRYTLGLVDNEYLKSVKLENKFSGFILHSMYIEYSHDGGEYKVAKRMTDIPEGSCINIVYVLTPIMGYPPVPPAPPTIERCVGSDCVPVTCGEECEPVRTGCKEECGVQETSYCALYPEADTCKDTCLETNGCYNYCEVECFDKPEPPVIEDPEWTTVKTLKFFGHGPLFNSTNWIGFEQEDSFTNQDTTKDLVDTRIINKFAISNGGLWSPAYDEFVEKKSASIVTYVYIQVRTTKLDVVPKDQYPEIKKVTFLSSAGKVELGPYEPSVVIIAKKDNNKNRAIFSNESNISWDIDYFDPLGKKMINYEWDYANIQDNKVKPPSKLEVGEHIIKLRAQNEDGLWSKWAFIQVIVKDEKPVAKLAPNDTLFYLNKEIRWTFVQSYDPDGDKIVAYEWRGNKQKIYKEEGSFSVGLRVKDEEGYWSDWTDRNFEITNGGYHKMRVEGDDTARVNYLLDGFGGSHKFLNSETATEGIYTSINGGTGGSAFGHYTATIPFSGSGFDLKLIAATNAKLKLKTSSGSIVYEVNLSNQENIEIKGLAEGNYSLILETVNSRAVSYIQYDYVDIFTTIDKPNLLKFNVSSISKSNQLSNNFVTSVDVDRFAGLRIQYELDKIANMTILIKDSKGKTVRVLMKNQHVFFGKDAIKTIDWDFKMDSGEKVRAGKYVAEFELTGEKGSKTIIKKDLLLEELLPIYYLEGETDITTKVDGFGSSATKTVSAEDRSGHVLNMRGGVGGSAYGGATASFNFTGNGYILYFKSLQNLTFRVYKDNVLISTELIKSKTNFELFDLNLEQGNYRIEMFTDSSRYQPDAGFMVLDYAEVFSLDDKSEMTNLTLRTVSEAGSKSVFGVQGFSPKLEGLEFSYKTTKNAYVTAEILDSTGKVVDTIITEQFHSNENLRTFLLNWDGKSNGNFVEKGYYTAKFTVKGIYNTETVLTKEFLVEDSDLATKVEAEGNFKLNPRGFGPRSSVVDNALGGKSLRIDGMCSGSVYGDITGTYSFTGTGISMKVDHITRVAITIKSSAGTVVYTNSSFTYSNGHITLVGLAPATYTVTLVADANYSCGAREETHIDYMYIYK